MAVMQDEDRSLPGWQLLHEFDEADITLLGAVAAQQMRESSASEVLTAPGVLAEIHRYPAQPGVEGASIPQLPVRPTSLLVCVVNDVLGQFRPHEAGTDPDEPRTRRDELLIEDIARMCVRNSQQRVRHMTPDAYAPVQTPTVGEVLQADAPAPRPKGGSRL